MDIEQLSAIEMDSQIPDEFHSIGNIDAFLSQDYLDETDITSRLWFFKNNEGALLATFDEGNSYCSVAGFVTDNEVVILDPETYDAPEAFKKLLVSIKKLEDIKASILVSKR